LQPSATIEYNDFEAGISSSGPESPERVSALSQDSHRRSWSRRWLPVLLLAGFAAAFCPAGGARGQDLVFYRRNSHTVLPLRTINRVQYLPALRLLTFFGQMGGLKGKRKALTIWFGNTRVGLRDNNKIVRLDNAKVRLAHPVRVEHGDWMVPVDFLTTVLPTLLNQPVNYQMGGSRVFIGDIHPNTFTLGVGAIPNGAQLTFQFVQPIQLQTAARNGKWVLFLGPHPIEPLESNFRFTSPYVSEVRFDDHDGTPKLIITPSNVGLDFFPKLTQGGRVLVAEIKQPAAPVAVPQPTASAGAPAQPSAGQTAAPVPQIPNPSTPLPAAPSLPTVVLDAGHGGSDTGARGKNGLLEKDLTAQIVARVRAALMATGKYQVVLTRTGDVNLTFNQRDTIANIAHPIAFITFHAGDLGPSIPRVNVYSYAPSSPADPDTASSGSPLFVPWDLVQLGYSSQSLRLAEDLQQELASTTHDASPKPFQLPIRVLRSVAAPAAAIEVGSLSPDTDPAPLTNPTFQNQIAAAVVLALAAFRAGAS
jgi:N-acetylmuramoyl-L-alanine amidase